MSVRFPFSLKLWWAMAGVGLVSIGGSLIVAEQWGWLLGLLAGLGVLATLAAPVASRLARPLRELAKAAALPGSPALGLHLPPGDEVAELAGAIERTRGEARLRLDRLEQEHNSLRAILASMSDGVIAVDEQERLVLLNRVAGRLLGLDAEAGGWSGKLLHEVIRVPQILSAVAGALERDEFESVEVVLSSSEGDAHLRLSAAPIRNGGDRSRGAVVVLHDTSELQRLESMRRDFVSNVSHELKTPLTAIRGYVETLLTVADVEEDTVRRFHERIQVQTSRLTMLVTDLLSLSRVESGSQGLERKPVDLRAPLLDSLRAFRPATEKKGLELSSVLPSQPVVVLGDEEALRQAFSNLLDNAIKYTETGKAIEVRLTHEPTHAVVSIVDQGQGIAREHQARIFERFYRADKARSRELGGTGLGLAIVKNVAIALGGTVSVESTPGKGSTFSVRLPLARAVSSDLSESR